MKKRNWSLAKWTLLAATLATEAYFLFCELKVPSAPPDMLPVGPGFLVGMRALCLVVTPIALLRIPRLIAEAVINSPAKLRKHALAIGIVIVVSLWDLSLAGGILILDLGVLLPQKRLTVLLALLLLLTLATGIASFVDSFLSLEGKAEHGARR